MSSRAVNAEAKISKVAAGAGCTEEGIIWMKNAIDPFPDVKRRIVGYPDAVRTPSVSQYFREELIVEMPSGLPGNWDCNIFHPGWVGGQALRPTPQEIFTRFTATGQATPVNTGLITVAADGSGSPLTLDSIRSCILPAVSLTSCPWRMVSLGFEVFNTTAPLYKQGGVTTWRQAAKWGCQRSVELADTMTTKITSASAQQYALPPDTSSKALMLEGSLEWEAEDGAYCVGVGSDPTNRQKYGLPLMNYMIDAGGNVWCPTLVAGTNTTGPNCVDDDSSFDQFGAYFTGLSPQTTLKVVTHFVIERFPDYTDPDLISIATSSIPFDPAALELYCKITSTIPTGTEVANNFLGAFLSGLAGVASQLAPPIISGLNSWLNPPSTTEVHESSRALETARVQLAEQQKIMGSMMARMPVLPSVPQGRAPRMPALPAVPRQRMPALPAVPRGPAKRRERAQKPKSIPAYVPTIKPNRPRGNRKEAAEREMWRELNKRYGRK